jgi:cell division FtsZ-interacting protein ZapD
MFNIFLCLTEEAQANLCDVSERHRQNQEILIDLTQQNKTYEAQIQTLKLEKSRLNAEYQMAKSNLENYENDKIEFVCFLLILGNFIRFK